MRNATCAASKTSKVPTQDALLFICYSMEMVDFEVSGCTCASIVGADLEGIKLDMSVLEARLLVTLSDNVSESESDIGLLKAKLKVFEGVIRNQHEAISHLNEVNVFFKSKLISLEKNCANFVPRSSE